VILSSTWANIEITHGLLTQTGLTLPAQHCALMHLGLGTNINANSAFKHKRKRGVTSANHS